MMADNTLRSGLRVFNAGGAGQLELQELLKVFETARSALDWRIAEAIAFDEFISEVGRRCHGGAARLKTAFRRAYGRPLLTSKDIVESSPVELLAIADFGDRSLLATKHSMQTQLSKQKLPLPTSWLTAPAITLISAWGQPPQWQPAQ